MQYIQNHNSHVKVPYELKSNGKLTYPCNIFEITTSVREGIHQKCWGHLVPCQACLCAWFNVNFHVLCGSFLPLGVVFS